MPDALNQKDIDALLDSSSRGSDSKSGTEAIAFDFRHPPRIARDRRAHLEQIFGRFALSLQALLSSRLREPADVIVNGVEQASFAEFLFSLTTPCASVVFDLYSDKEFQGIMDFGTDTGFYIIDRLFGGPGDAPSLKRSMTQLEQHVIRGVSDRALELFQNAWDEEIRFSIKYAGLEANPDTLAIADRDENVLVANLELRAGRFAGPIVIALPLHALESFLQEKRSRIGKAKVIPDEERTATRAVLKRSLSAAKLRIRVRFPPFRLRTRDLAALEPGQVIHTGHHLEVPIDVIISDTRRFIGTMGQVHQNLGVRVTSAVSTSGNSVSPNTPRGRVL